MKPNEMEPAILRNLAAKTGRSLDESFKVLRDTGLTDKRELKDQLKLVCGVGHFQAQPITKHHLLL